MPDQPKPCSKHPRYQGKREPIVPCKECQAIYDAKAFDRACEVANVRQETLHKLAAEEALLTLQVLKELAYDVWGSANLHFDGDCFGEFEWCVVMRGGGFDQKRSFAQGKTALEAVLKGLGVKYKAMRRCEHKKKLKGLVTYYTKRAQELAAQRKELEG